MQKRPSAASRIMRTRLSRDVWLNKPLRLPDIDPLYVWLTDAG